MVPAASFSGYASPPYPPPSSDTPSLSTAPSPAETPPPIPGMAAFSSAGSISRLCLAAGLVFAAITGHL
ncbi:hypothetical protein MLD38_013698 [Melastoma candidum]|nr:hypothetical protein MLD38_013698 [Melastoma candidum]